MKLWDIILLLILTMTSCQQGPQGELMEEKTVVIQNTEVQKSDLVLNQIEGKWYYEDASFTPRWLTPESAEEQDFHTIQDFAFVNQLGDTITQETFDDKIYVTDFFFTSCPGICREMTDNMSKVQAAFENDPNVLLLSHSVTPSRDSVSVLRKYADEHGAIDDKWHLVTGDRTEIYNLGRNQYFVENEVGGSTDTNNFLHTENFLLIDKEKHIRGIYMG